MTTAASGAFDAQQRFAEVLHKDSKRRSPGEAFAPGIVPTSIYALASEPQGDFQYARWANPGWSDLEHSLGLLEDAHSVIFPSGSAAIAAVLSAVLRPGDGLLLPEDGYMGTRTTAKRYFASQGVRLHACRTRKLAQFPLEGIHLMLIETPSNPGLDLVDIAACARRARAAGALLVVDNTVMTPLGQRPLDLGADVTVSSDTKVVNGHSDAVFGHVSTRRPDILERVVEWRRVCGAVPGPFETWMVQRGLDTLELRVSRMHDNALALARAIEAQGGVGVAYPGLARHPQHALAQRQMLGFGCLVGVEFPDAARAERFIDASRFLRPCTSFGGLHSSAERRARWGDDVGAGFVRLSVGCEPAAALCADVLGALQAALGGG